MAGRKSKKNTALMDPDMIKMYAKKTHMSEEEVVETMSLMKIDESIHPEDMLDMLNANVQELDRKQRKEGKGLSKILDGVRTGNLSLIKAGCSVIPYIGGKIVPFRSYSELLEDQLYNTMKEKDDLADQIDILEKKRNETSGLMDQYKDDRLDLRDRRIEAEKDLKSLETEFNKIDKTYISMKKKFKKNPALKSNEAFLKVEDARDTLDNQLYKKSENVRLLINRISQISNLLEFSRLFKKQTGLKLQEAKAIHDTMAQQIDLVEPSLKAQKQGMKLTEIATTGIVELDKLKTLANETLIIMGEMGSYLTGLNKMASGDFYEEETLANYARSINDTMKKQAINRAHVGMKDDEKHLSLTQSYKILDLDIGRCGDSKSEVEKTIRKAYHAESMKVHPDVNKSPNALMEFEQLTNAYKKVYKQELGELPNNV